MRCVQSDESLIMSLSMKIRVPHQPHGYPLVDQHRRGPTMCRSLGKPWLLSTSMLVDKTIMLDLRIHDYLKYLPYSGTPTYPITLLLHIRNIHGDPHINRCSKSQSIPRGWYLSPLNILTMGILNLPSRSLQPPSSVFASKVCRDLFWTKKCEL